jgi:microcystin-dependent protein
MTQPFLGEIRLFPWDWSVRGWALCSGQIMAIAQNQALFALLGTTYGGNGVQTFALPDLRGRTALAPGQMPGGPNYVLGEIQGEESHVLTVSEIPAHVHAITTSSGVANQVSPASARWANGGHAAYSTANPDSTMHPAALSTTGGNQSHENRSPYLALNYSIALQGLFPSRN